MTSKLLSEKNGNRLIELLEVEPGEQFITLPEWVETRYGKRAMLITGAEWSAIALDAGNGRVNVVAVFSVDACRICNIPIDNGDICSGCAENK